MAISFAQTPDTVEITGGDDGCILATTSPVTAGNRIVFIICGYDDGDFNSWSPSGYISKSAGTATLGAFTIEASTCTREIYGGNAGSIMSCIVSAEITGSGTLELTFDPGTSNTDYAGTLCELTDVDADVSAEDVSDVEGGTSSPYDSEDMTSADAAMFLGVWIGADGDSGTITPATGFTEIVEDEGSWVIPYSMIYKVVSTGTTDAVEWSAVASSSWDVSAAVFTELLSVSATAALTGTITSAYESDLTTGGETVILTLTDDTWIGTT